VVASAGRRVRPVQSAVITRLAEGHRACGSGRRCAGSAVVWPRRVRRESGEWSRRRPRRRLRCTESVEMRRSSTTSSSSLLVGATEQKWMCRVVDTPSGSQTCGRQRESHECGRAVRWSVTAPTGAVPVAARQLAVQRFDYPVVELVRGASPISGWMWSRTCHGWCHVLATAGWRIAECDRGGVCPCRRRSYERAGVTPAERRDGSSCGGGDDGDVRG